MCAARFGNALRTPVGGAGTAEPKPQRSERGGRLPDEGPALDRAERKAARAEREAEREARRAERDAKDPKAEAPKPSPSREKGPKKPEGAGLPTGPIRTAGPGGGGYGADWFALTRWVPLMAEAAAFARVAIEGIGPHVVVETGGTGDPRAVQRNESNGWSWRLMQVVPLGKAWAGWHALVFEGGGPGDPVHLLYAPAVNLKVGARILRIQYDYHGDWDKASSAFFLGKPDWRGWDPVNGNTGPASRATLNGLVGEWTAAAPAKEAPGTPAGAPKLPANLVWFEGCANFHDRNGVVPVAIEHHATDDMDYGNVGSWFKHRSSNASAHAVIEPGRGHPPVRLDAEGRLHQRRLPQMAAGHPVAGGGDPTGRGRGAQPQRLDGQR